MAKKRVRYEPWQIRDFSAGMVEKLNDNILPDNAAHECRNVIAARFGGLSKRKGYTNINTAVLPAAIQGLHPYYARTTNIRRLLAMAGGLGYLWDGTNFERLTWPGAESIVGDAAFPLFGTPLWSEVMFNHPDDVFPLDPSVITLFEDAVNYVVSMNGIDVPWKWDGSVITMLANAPAKGRYPLFHKEKLFCVDTDEPSQLLWSESFDPEDWPPTYYWDVRKGDGDVITCLLRFVGDLIIFKNRSIHALKGTSLDDFSLDEVSSVVGCVGPLAAVVHDLKIFFVSEYGLYVSNGMNTLNVSSMVIPETWDRVNKQYLHKAAVAVWDELIWVSVPIDNSTVNNYVIVYDPKKQAFWPMTEIDASCYTYYNDGTGAGVKLYSGNPTDGYVKQEDNGYADNNSPIEAYWRGKYFDMGIPEIEKKTRKLYMQDSPDTTEVADIAVSLDYGSYDSLIYSESTGHTREYLFDVDANRWRYISPEITHNSTGACEVRGIAIPYKPKARLAVREQ